MKAIVLAGDKNYLTPIFTTIKSILYYNQNVKIYILHQDIPSDWLQELKIQVEKLGSVVEDIRIDEEIDSEWKTQEHISAITLLAISFLIILKRRECFIWIVM